MKRSKAHLLRSLAVTLIACAGLASCTQDDFAGKPQGEPLPQGKYPMTFTAVQAAPEGMPQTRVSDYDEGSTHKSKWTTGDKIKVKVTTEDNAKVQESICTLDEHGTITNYNPQLYWQTTGKHTINAWYSNIDGQSTETEESKTVSLADQKQGLAYVLKAKEAEVSFENRTNSTELSFTHQLAKVRVKLKGETEAVKSVQVKGYTSCTITDGLVSVSDKNSMAYIKMYKNDGYYEANLVPMESIKADDFIKLNENTQATISNISRLDAATMYTIEITVEGKTVTIDKDCTVTNDSKPLVINGDHTVTFDGAIITANGIPAIKIESGSPTLIFSGTNKIKREDNNATIEIASSAELTIQLEDGAKLAVYNSIKCYSNSTLEIKGNSSNNELYIESNTIGCPAIEMNNMHINLSISNVTLTAVSGDSQHPGSSAGNRNYTPSIGNGQHGVTSSPDKITLSNGNFTFYATTYEDATVEHWVSYGTVTPNVDELLKDNPWNQEVYDTNSKVTLKKLENRPTPPTWAQ